MSGFLSAHFPMNVEGLSEYPDFFAFAVTLAFSWAIAVGAKESTRLNNVFTILNLAVVLFVIIAGLFKGKLILSNLFLIIHKIAYNLFQ